MEMQREQKIQSSFARTKVSDLSLLQKEKKTKILGQHFEAARVTGGNEAAMAVVEPPTTMVDATEELPTGLSEESLGVRLKSLQKLERVLVQQVVPRKMRRPNCELGDLRKWRNDGYKEG
eukprot:Skav227003  [mRNA]  locus=scaffold4219:205344:208685:- [translate_table: standard]